MITIEDVNNMISIVNKINFMVADIADEIGDYSTITRIGEYMPISDNTKYSVLDDDNIVIIYTQCVIGRSARGSWIRDEVLKLDKRLFDLSIPKTDLYNRIYINQLNNIRDEILKKKKEIDREYKDILGAEYMINSYINKGLHIESI